MGKTFLHVGCGQARKQNTTEVFKTDEWSELRYDIDENCEPDVIGTMTDMSTLDDNSFDAIYSSHNIEHLFFHEVQIALKEFIRVLKDDGRICVNHVINQVDKINRNINRFPIMDIRNIQEHIGFNVHKLVVWEDKSEWSWKASPVEYLKDNIETELVSAKIHISIHLMNLF